MPRLCGGVIDPSRVGAWECQDVKAVALLLIGVGQSV